jgi:peptidyl-prolyl cis-trans isomerase C
VTIGEQVQTQLPVLAYHVLRTALNRFGKPPADLDAHQRAAIEYEARKEYVLEDRILGSVEARDVIIPTALVESSLQTVKSRYEDGDAFHAELARNRMDEEALREALRRELAVEAVLDRVAARAARVSEVDAMIYYYMHLDRFNQPETRTVRQILVTVNDDFAENRRDAAQERIVQIQRRLQHKPHRFGEQAHKHSECPSALNGGLLGQLPRGQLYAELDTVLFAMEEGQISEPVESEMGFHLLYCERIHAAGPASFAEAKERILELLRKRRRRMCQRTWLSSLTQNGAEAGEGTRQ